MIPLFILPIGANQNRKSNCDPCTINIESIESVSPHLSDTLQ